MGPVGTDGVWKDSGRLADGREIIYFDESPGLGRAAVPDLRPLAADPSPGATPGNTLPAPGWPESGLRWDALRGEWVVIAAQRQDRTFLPPTDECPLDPSRAGRLTEIPADTYDVVVFENRFPSLRATAAWSPGTGPPGACQPGTGQLGTGQPSTGQPGTGQLGTGPPETGGVPGRPAFGRCEEVGVTLHHPHGQIYGFPFVTPMTSRMVTQARGYAARNGRNLFDDLVAGEIAAGIRLVARNEHWTAFVPAAARWPYEVLLFPADRVADIPALSDQARSAFCDLYLDVLHRLDALFGVPLPYIAAWHQAPTRDEFARHEFGLHLQVLSVRRAPGRLKYLAGTESGMGVWINDVLPEEAALRLREAG